mgnify:CR=1 FL=1
MPDMEKVISDIEQQIRWIEEIECHKFPGWLNVTNAMRDALALLKEQEAVVRCKDCKHRSKEMYDYYGDPNDKVYVCHINDIAKKPDWFWADGERQEGR